MSPTDEVALQRMPEIRERSHEGELDVTLTSIEGGLAVCKLVQGQPHPAEPGEAFSRPGQDILFVATVQ